MFKKISYILLGISLTFSSTAFAVQISVPSANGSGFLLQSLTNGTYSPVSLIAGSNVTISTTTSSITISSSGGGSAFPFTVDSYGGSTVQSTTTGLWLKALTPFSLIASSTLFTYASTSQLDVTGTATSTFGGSIVLGHPYTLTAHGLRGDASDGLYIFANNYTQVADFGIGNSANATFYGGVNVTGNLSVLTGSTLTVADLTSALTLTGAGGIFAEYTGTSCTNQFVRSLSALGVATCATVANTDLANSSITINGSSVSLGGSITVASTTLLSDLNNWTKRQDFSNTTTSLASFSYSSSTDAYFGTGQGIAYIGSGGRLRATATSTFSLSQFTNDLAALTALDTTLTFSGSYNGSVARTIGLNLGNANTWTALQTFGNSTTTYGSFTNASTTNLFVGTGQGALYAGSGQAVKAVSTSTPTVTAPITYSGTLGSFIGGVAGAFDCTTANASTKGCIAAADFSKFNSATTTFTWPLIYTGATNAVTFGWSTTTALSAGQAVYASGVNSFASIATSTPTIGASLSYSGTIGNMFGGSSGTLSLNTANANTWSALQTFANSSTTLGSFAYASSTLWYGGGLSTCTGSNFLQWSSGIYSCAASSASGGVSTETPSGTVNGSNTAFTVTNSPTQVFLNGQLQIAGGVDYTLTGTGPYTITFVTAPNTGSNLQTLYSGVSTGSINSGTAGQLTYYGTTGNTLSGSSLLGIYSSRFGIGTTSPFGFVSINADGIGAAPQFVIGSSTATDLILTNKGWFGYGTSTPDSQFTIQGDSTTDDVFDIDLSSGAHAMQVTSTGLVGFGTSTPKYSLVSYSNSSPQFSLSAGSGIAQWVMRNLSNGDFWFGTTTAQGSATTTSPAIYISGSDNNIGFGTSTPIADLAIQAHATGDIFDLSSVTGTSLLRFTNTGLLGIGTSSPMAFMSVGTSTTSTGTVLPLFALASTSAAGNKPVFMITRDNHITTSGLAPALTTCGTSPSITGNDTAGVITMGTAAPTVCRITFATAYATAPSCTISGSAPASALGTVGSFVSSTTATTLQIMNKATTTGNTWIGMTSFTASYHCIATQ